MFLFNYLLMNRSLERWFSPSAEQLRDDSASVVRGMVQYLTENARAEAESIAASGAPDRTRLSSRLSWFRTALRWLAALPLSTTKNRRCWPVFRRPRGPLWPACVPGCDEGRAARPQSTLHGPLSGMLLAAAQRGDEAVAQCCRSKVRAGHVGHCFGQGRGCGHAHAAGLEPAPPSASTPAPQTIGSSSAPAITFAPFSFSSCCSLQSSSFSPASGWRCFCPSRSRGPLRRWPTPWTRSPPANMSSALHPSPPARWATWCAPSTTWPPILKPAASWPRASQAQLTAANLAVEERRRELETIVETIPSGVVTLDARRRHPAIQSRLCRAHGTQAKTQLLAGQGIEALLPAECADDLAGVIRRGHRMGAASTEVEFHARGRTIHLAITSARLDLGHGQTRIGAGGRRHHRTAARAAPAGVERSGAAVAHEIKNPLTPIALSAPSASAGISTAASPIRPTSSANAARSFSAAWARCARWSISSPRWRSFPRRSRAPAT